jgi:hypothetical protein
MPAPLHPDEFPQPLRRRNRRLGLLLAAFALATALWTFWPVHHGWIYPEDTSYAFPHWMKK